MGGKQMRNRSIIILLLLCWTMAGCMGNRITRYNAFTSPVNVFDSTDMTIGARLIGEEGTWGGDTGRAQAPHGKLPYNLMIYVISKTGFYRSVRIAYIQLLDAGKRRIPIPDSATQVISPFKEHLGRYLAAVTTTDLDLTYEPHLVKGIIEIITQANSTFTQSFQFVLEPTYGKKTPVDAWTRVMEQ